MDKMNGNKENSSPPMNASTITGYFKMKKCLFDSPKPMEVDSPKLKTPSPVLKNYANTSPYVDSPYSLFKIKKKDPGIERAATCHDLLSTTPQKKFILMEQNLNTPDAKTKSAFLFESPIIKAALQKSIQNPNLIGDFSKPCILPVVNGKHPDLMTIEAETAVNVLSNWDSSKYTIIDCRYPYEYEGGHIRGAKNIYYKEDIVTELLTSHEMLNKNETRNVIIFYCEFSSERAPNMFRFLRTKDREMNRNSYPFLYYPELYLLNGGYKSFFMNFKEFCDPRDYVAMLDKDFSQDLSFYRAKCKAYSRRMKRRRSVLQF